MSLKLYLWNRTKDVTPVEPEMRKFPGGETFLRLPQDIDADSATISLHFQGNADLFDLALMVDALRRQYGPSIRLYLHMSYLPYARQDRVCSPGESLSVKVLADFINGLKFNEVRCDDIHSNVGEALIDNLLHNNLNDCFQRFNPMFTNDTILVSPDAGANKKVVSLAKEYGFKQVVRADKTRDLTTNAITGTVVYSEHVGNKDFLIVDDICDGGRTFTELAKELRKLTDGKIYLYVSHGIFSYGLGVFDGLIDHIYVNNLMREDAYSSPLVTVF